MAGTYVLTGCVGNRNPMASKSPGRVFARHPRQLRELDLDGVEEYRSAGCVRLCLARYNERHAKAWRSCATACWSRRRLRRRLLLRVESGASSLRADSAL